jgi:hypothetical protein
LELVEHEVVHQEVITQVMTVEIQFLARSHLPEAVAEDFKVPLTQQETVDLAEAEVAIQLSQALHQKVE